MQGLAADAVRKCLIVCGELPESDIARTIQSVPQDAEEWVSAQRYNDESWPAVIELWRAYNMHLLHVVSVIPQQVLTQPRDKHSLDRIAFKTVERNTPATLEYLIRDYVDHLKHHLDQIWRRSWHTPTNN